MKSPQKDNPSQDNSRLFQSLINLGLLSDFVFLDEVDSTNKFAKSADLKSPALIIAEYQSEGRGRFTRNWFSESGQNIMFSLILNLKMPKDKFFILNFYISFILCCVLQKIIPSENVSLKWPNDILVNNKKISGILTEIHNDKFIIGVGININQNVFIAWIRYSIVGAVCHENTSSENTPLNPPCQGGSRHTPFP